MSAAPSGKGANRAPPLHRRAGFFDPLLFLFPTPLCHGVNLPFAVVNLTNGFNSVQNAVSFFAIVLLRGKDADCLLSAGVGEKDLRDTEPPSLIPDDGKRICTDRICPT